VKYLFLSISVWLAVLANNAYSKENRPRDVTESIRLRLAAKSQRHNSLNPMCAILANR
jgi:hypothetical protein